MRVESCGPIFAKPSEGHFCFSNHRLSEPITIINPKNNLLVGENEDEFLKLDNVRVASDVRRGLPVEHPLSVDFFLTEEEWSLFKQPNFGSGEPKKMSHFPYSPLTSLPTCTDFNLSQDSFLQKQSQLYRSSGNLSRELMKDDEPNNNNVIRKVSFPELEGSDVHRTDYATPLQDERVREDQSSQVRPLSPNEYYNCSRNASFSNQDTSAVRHSPISRSSSLPKMHADEQITPNLEISMNPGNTISHGGYIRQIPPVDTIGSHPQPITSVSSSYSHVHSPSQCQHILRQEKASGENWVSEYEQECTQDYFEDWQSQSIFLSSEVDKAKLKWNQNQHNGGFRDGVNSGGCQFKQSDTQLVQDPSQTTTGRTDDMNTLITFLSKFDDKVAAIWGGGQQHEGGTYGIGLTYPEAYLSTCSTPVSCNMYPWASPTVETHMGQPRYDIRAMQNQIDQQQLLASQHYTSYAHGEPQINYSNYESVQRPGVSRHPNELEMNTAIIMPPNGNNNSLMNSLKEHFGTVPTDEDYHIFKIADVEASVEEKEASLSQLNHNDECSSFKRFIPQLYGKQVPVAVNSELERNHSELDIGDMQEIFGSLDLEGDEGLEDFNSEVTDFLKSKPRTFYEQHFPPVDLFHSWTTHFTPIDVMEKTSGYRYSSPPGILQPGHENDPNLPEYYTLFAGIEKEYNIFLKPAKTLFPIRFKLCPQPGKSVQTDEPQYMSAVEDHGRNQQQHDPFRHLTVYDWGNFGYNNEDHLSVSSGSRTPFDFKTRTVMENNNFVNVKATDEFLDGTGFGGGLARSEYDYLDNGTASGFQFAQSDYCCDSGIGIDGSSRAGFYDDLYPEYEGDFDYSGGLDEGVLQPYSTAIDNDVDYGQFQEFSYSTWSTSSTSGKAGKNSRSRTKGKPCKYFLAEGSCKRGQNCKFSHDLTATTCRYWAEGSCLKGDACPYLHCFIEGNSFAEHKERRRAGKRYHLESENDFPALGAFGNRNSTNKTLSSREQTSVPHSSIVGNADAGSSVEESLLMLADPAGSMYESFGYGLQSECEGFSVSIQEEQTVAVPFFMKNTEKLQRNVNSRLTTGKQSGSTWPRQGNKGSSNSNWISSMIGVKEKRRKKKQ